MPFVSSRDAAAGTSVFLRDYTRLLTTASTLSSLYFQCVLG